MERNADNGNLKSLMEQQDEPSCWDEDGMLNDNDPDDLRLLEEYRYIRNKQNASVPDTKEAWERFRKQHIQKKTSIRIPRKLLIRYAAAAIILAIAIPVAWHATYKSSDDENKDIRTSCYPLYNIKENGHIIAFEADNRPKVTMIGTEDGKQKPLDKAGKCKGMSVEPDKAVFSSVPLTQIEDIAKRTITTPRGKDFEVVLSDGTTVFLNADSRLVFPVNFAANERIVELNGEAFFSVAEDTQRPFIVKTAKITATVLGTEFDIRAYEDSRTEITLIKGSVKVRNNASDEDETILKPGQNAYIAYDGKMDVINTGTDYYTKWKEGIFHFDNTQLINVMKDMGRWYNVDVEITDSSIKFYPLSFELSRACSLMEFINKLNSLNFLSVKLESNKVIVSKKEKATLPSVPIKMG